MHKPLEKMVYITCPLTGLEGADKEELYAFYEDIAAICREFNLTPFLPHHWGDPKVNAQLTPEQIDRQDRRAVTMSLFAIAYVGRPTTGGGIEIEMANHANKPVILLYEANHQTSRLVLGNPAVTHRIAFNTKEDALTRLRFAIQAQLDRFESFQLPTPLRHELTPNLKTA